LAGSVLAGSVLIASRLAACALRLGASRIGALRAVALRFAALFVAFAALFSSGCRRDEESSSEPAPPVVSAAPVPRMGQAPVVLEDFPSGSAQTAPPSETASAPLVLARSSRCPPEMVEVGAAYCIDRFEVSLVDVSQGRRVSPSYPPTHEQTLQLFERWTKRSAPQQTRLSRALAVPAPPDFQLREEFRARATSAARVLPNGYLSRSSAEQACTAAGKRLCTHGEWVHACRGQANRQFPYGTQYQDGQCNVNREAHPASLLHGNASIHHLDPRLPLVKSKVGPLLRETGATATCASRWGDDAIYDMVGNLDEWIDDAGGSFAGGFFSRATRDGCDSLITVHGPEYFDYSLGTRCCRALNPPAGF
jgi:formylglycine-generating enzyme required for sulfatase activity